MDKQLEDEYLTRLNNQLAIFAETLDNVLLIDFNLVIYNPSDSPKKMGL